LKNKVGLEFALDQYFVSICKSRTSIVSK